MSNLTPDDPKLTAYALDELPADERAAVEARLATDPAARAAVDEARATADLVTAALAAEPAPPLRLTATPRPAPARRPGRVAWPVTAAAASIALVLLVGQQLRPEPGARSGAVVTFGRLTAEGGSESTGAPATRPRFGQGAAAIPSKERAADGVAVKRLPAQGPRDVKLSVPKNSTTAAPTAVVAGARPQPRGQAPEWDTLFTDGHVGERRPGAVAPGMVVANGQRDERLDRILADPIIRAGEKQDGVPPHVREQSAAGNTEAYDRIVDNAFLTAAENPLSTFSIDVDTASYANVRRFLTAGQFPPPDAVRIEELVNYFPYQYDGPAPSDPHPFAARVEVAACPWAPQHRLARIAIKGKSVAAEQRPPANIVFLIDVSGSMNEPNKLPLVKQSLRKLVGQLRPDDRVAMCVYAGSAGLVLPSTRVGEGGLHDRRGLAELYRKEYEPKIVIVQGQPVNKRQIDAEFQARVAVMDAHHATGRATIIDAIDRLEAGGSTNGAEGIVLAYNTAQSEFVRDGVNRVVLATDGDFNVGVTDQGQLVRLIEEKAKANIFLSVLGFGMGNLKDSTMEKLADKGNGNYAYVDTLREAEKVLVREMDAALVTIAKDVKVQVEFNPATVGSYRLIGYENRVLAKEDFNDDKKDAGEIGAGHTVTALYEVVPAGVKPPGDAPVVHPLKYAPKPAASKEEQRRGGGNELLTVKLRYKAPDAPADVQGTSRLVEFPVTDEGKSLAAASPDFKFAAAVAQLGMLLRNSPHKGSATLAGARELAAEGKGADATGEREEFLSLIDRARGLGAR